MLPGSPSGCDRSSTRPFSAHPRSVWTRWPSRTGRPRHAACALPAQACAGAASALAQVVREVVQGLLGLRPEVVVTPIGFAPGSLRLRDVPTCSCPPRQRKMPRSCFQQGLDVTNGSRQGRGALGSDTTGYGRGAAHISRLKVSPPNPCPCGEVVPTQAAPVLRGASACLAPSGCTSDLVRVRGNFYFIFLR